MKRKTKRLLARIGLVVAIVGGAVHVLSPIGFNLLGIFGGAGKVIQFVAGAVTIAVSVLGLKMSKKILK